MSRFYARNGAGDLLARYSFIEPLLSGRRVLELGAAGVTAGASALFLAERGAAAVVSIDDDPGAVELASRESQHPFVQFKTAAIEALPAKAFDLILVADGGALAADPARVAALHRLLGPRGRLVTALPAGQEGSALGQLVGEPPPGEQPTFESFVGALGEHFAFVEVATQSATVGYVVAMGQDPEPEISIDGSLAGTSDTAWYVAICGDATCGLQGLNIVALPTQPLFEAAAEHAGVADAGAAAEAQAARDALAAELEAASKERDDALGGLEAARLELERRDAELAALEAERTALQADRDAIAEARAEADRGAAALREELDAHAARVREVAASLDAEREANFDLRATADKAQALEAQRAGALEDAARAVEERDQAMAELAGIRARVEEADAAHQAARAEAQAASSALEAALARATVAEGRTHELEEGADASAKATADRLAQLEAELAGLRAGSEAAAGELAAARDGEAARAAEVAAVKAEAAALAAERDALRERADSTRTASEELQARAVELEVRAAEVDRLTAELARRDDAAAEANAARETLEARVAELGALLESEEERLRRTEAQEAEARALLEAARADLASSAGGGEEVAQLTSGLAQAIAEREHFEKLAAESRNAADEAQAQAAELEAELQAVRWDKDELEQRLQAQQGAVGAGAGADVARLRDEVAQRTARIVEQEREIARLEEVVSELASQPSVGTSPSPQAQDERVQELERRLEEADRLREDAERRAGDAEGRASAEPAYGGDEAGAERAQALERLKSERDSLQAQVVERDARLARMQREVVDKTDRLGRLAKEMGELKAKGIGKIFK